MRTREWLVITAMCAAGAAPLGAQAPRPPRVLMVEMVDVSPTEFAYSPAELTVQPGDLVRFVQKGVMPHNVEFRGARAEALGAQKLGPFLVTKGQVYELPIDGRFATGEYPFVCTPHEAMGMKGKLIVVEPEGG